MQNSLKTYLTDRFNLKENDYIKIKYLFAFSFFLGLFIAFYFVVANSAFVKSYGHQELPYAYIISGIVGLLAISIYTYVQSRHRTKTLFFSAVAGMFLVSLSAWLLNYLLEKNFFNFSFNERKEYQDWLNFFVFIWAWPFIAMVATVTGGVAIRLLNLLQVKKFYGLINLGGVSAAVISYFTISQLLKLLHREYDLILIGLFGLIGAFYLVHIIYKKFPEEKKKDKSENRKHRKIKGKNIFKDKFVVFIFLGATLSAIIIYLTDYGFLVTVKSAGKTIFSNDIRAVPRFLSFIYGGLKIGELIISLLSGRILTKYGVRLGLLALPISISLIFIAAYFDAIFFGVTTIGFLMIMSAGKMWERIVRRGIDDPAFNVLYQTLEDDKKLYIQTRVGLVQQFSIALAGVILLLLNFLLHIRDGEFRIESYPLYALIILFLAVIVAIILYRQYKNKVKQILADKKIFYFDYVEKDIFAIDTLKMFILSEDKEASKFCTIVLTETNPRSLETYASFLIKVDDPIIRKSVLANIDSTYNEKLVPIIEKVGDKVSFKNRELKKLFLEAFFKLDYSEIEYLTPEQVREMAFSDDVKQQVTAIKYIYRKKFYDKELVYHLLNSPEKNVKFSAIKIAAKIKDRELWQELVKMLEDKQYSHVVVTILTEIGDSILNPVYSLVNQTEDISVIKNIIQIFAKVGTPKAQRLLVKMLDYPDRKIRHLAILALQYSGFVAREDTIINIRNKIRDVVENIVWYLVSIKDLVHEKNTLRLIQSLDLERLASLDDLYTLLSFTQSPEIVDLIKENIIGENTVFALELIDNYIDTEIKKMIIPLFEPISLGQKIRRLRQYFYFQPIGSKKRLIDIVLSDASKIDSWSQTMALELLNKYADNDSLNISRIKLPQKWKQKDLESIKKTQISALEAIYISLLNPFDLVFNATLKILKDRDIELDDKIRQHLDSKKLRQLAEVERKQEFLLDKIKKLRRVYLFFAVPERSLQEVAGIVVHKDLEAGDKVTFNYKDSEYIIILVKGQLYFPENDKSKYSRKTMLIRGLNVPSRSDFLIAERPSKLILIKRAEFFNLLASNNDLIVNLLRNVRF